jgi:hypothetical protein
MPGDSIRRHLQGVDRIKFEGHWLLVSIVGNRRLDAIILVAHLVIVVESWGKEPPSDPLKTKRVNLWFRLECEYDNESIQASSNSMAMAAAVTSPGSTAGDSPVAQRMDRFEFRY